MWIWREVSCDILRLLLFFWRNEYILYFQGCFEKGSEVSYEVTFKGTTYKKSQFLVIGKPNDVEFGEIQFLIISEKLELYFLMKIYKSTMLRSLNIFAIEDANCWCLKKADELPDYYPLNGYKIHGISHIALKHSISQIFN